MLAGGFANEYQEAPLTPTGNNGTISDINMRFTEQIRDDNDIDTSLLPGEENGQIQIHQQLTAGFEANGQGGLMLSGNAPVEAEYIQNVNENSILSGF